MSSATLMSFFFFFCGNTLVCINSCRKLSLLTHQTQNITKQYTKFSMESDYCFSASSNSTCSCFCQQAFCNYFEQRSSKNLSIMKSIVIQVFLPRYECFKNNIPYYDKYWGIRKSNVYHSSFNLEKINLKVDLIRFGEYSQSLLTQIY